MREWTIAELQEAYRDGTTDPVAVCRDYLMRIEKVDRSGPAINAVIEVNPDALEIAAARAAEIRDGRATGLLHGIPVLLKDNIDTGDAMKTTAGSLALADAPQPADAFLVERLRAEGAVILGKTNLSEWANFRSTSSNSGWSSRGGQTRNPYVLDRTPCGSSSGSGAAVAANLAVVAVGTETDGSVTCPSAHNSLVGLKPTVGTVSRTGIIPISTSQDTAGPMARTVRDAAILLQAMAGRDAEDRAGFAPADYLANLDKEFLRGRRIGIARNRADVHREALAPFAAALDALAAAGAELIDPVAMPDLSEAGTHELTVLRYEFRQGLIDYFARRNRTGGGARAAGPDPAPGNHPTATAHPTPGARIATIEDVIRFNEEHADVVLRIFGQEHMLAAAQCGPLTDEAYLTALRESRRIAGAEGVEALLTEHRLDAIVAPTNGPSWLIDHVNGDYYTGGAMSTGPAIAGLPHLTAPMGYAYGLPLGLSFVSARREDAKLLGIAYAYECANPVRRPPEFRESIGLMNTRG
jgi:amidase